MLKKDQIHIKIGSPIKPKEIEQFKDATHSVIFSTWDLSSQRETV